MRFVASIILLTPSTSWVLLVTILVFTIPFKLVALLLFGTGLMLGYLLNERACLSFPSFFLPAFLFLWHPRSCRFMPLVHRFGWAFLSSSAEFFCSASAPESRLGGKLRVKVHSIGSAVTHYS